jgi:uncharacterized protein YdhG (YjbR/CyaY superfamily)
MVYGDMMETNKGTVTTIDAYIAGFPADVREVLEKIRAIVHQTAPEAQETIKYKMPTFVLLGGNLVHFAAFKKHIGFYPPVAASGEFKAELALYEGPKRSLIFPLDRPIPYDLIRRIVAARVRENRSAAAAKKKK